MKLRHPLSTIRDDNPLPGRLADIVARSCMQLTDRYLNSFHIQFVSHVSHLVKKLILPPSLSSLPPNAPS